MRIPFTSGTASPSRTGRPRRASKNYWSVSPVFDRAQMEAASCQAGGLASAGRDGPRLTASLPGAQPLQGQLPWPGDRVTGSARSPNGMIRILPGRPSWPCGVPNRAQVADLWVLPFLFSISLRTHLSCAIGSEPQPGLSVMSQSAWFGLMTTTVSPASSNVSATVPPGRSIATWPAPACRSAGPVRLDRSQDCCEGPLPVMLHRPASWPMWAFLGATSG